MSRLRPHSELCKSVRTAAPREGLLGPGAWGVWLGGRPVA